MAWTLVNSAAGAGTTVGIDTTGADLLIAIGCSENATITDSKGNTWTGLTQQANGNMRTQIQYCRGGAVGSGHTFTQAWGYGAVVVLAFSGSATTPFDVEAGIGSAGGSPGSAGGPLTPANDGSLVIAGWGMGSNADPTSMDGGFTLAAEVPGVFNVNYGAAIAYLIQSSAASASPAMTFSGGSTAVSGVMAAFKGTGGGGSAVPNITLVGAENILSTSASYRVTLDYA